MVIFVETTIENYISRNLSLVVESQHLIDMTRVKTLLTGKICVSRRDARKGPLQAPYDGPFEVVDQSAKYFTLRLGIQLDNISIDRLKPAYLDESQPTTVAQPPRLGRPPKLFPTQPPLTSQTEHTQTTPNQPTYAEITTLRGRISKLPQRYRL